MADKKFKSNVDIQADLKLSNATTNRALVIDGSNNVVESTTTDTQIGYLSNLSGDIQASLDAKVDDSEKGAANGVATLDANSKIPSSQLPAIAITEVFAVADIAARDALTIGAGDGEVQEGDVVRVTDASADVNITSGAASYIYDGSAYVLLKAGDEVLSVNGETGVVALDADDIDDAATINKFVTAADVTKLGHISVTQAVDLDTMESDIALNNASRHDALTLNAGAATQESASLTGQELTLNQATTSTDGVMSAEDKTKLDGIEALADVTDATNVAAAGATMDSDTSLVGNGYFLDEDDMSSDDATKVPSQQSVKAYVDNNAGNLASGDIKNSTFSGAADTATNLDVTGLAFANGTVRGFEALVTVVIDATADLYETFKLMGVQKAAGWDMSVESVGDDSQVSFTITAAGQVQYSKTSTAGWVSTTINFRADTVNI